MSTQFTTIEKAVQQIKSNQSVFIHSAAATPKLLVDAMSKRSSELSQVKIYSIHTEWEALYSQEPHINSFEINAFFVGANIRKAIQENKANYIPMFLSEIPVAFRTGLIPLNVALISVSPPDKHGNCTLGVSCDVSRAAVEVADIVIAEINPNMPRVNGDGVIALDEIDFAIEVDYPIFELPVSESSDIEIAIGENVASLIEDGATLQMGIGGIPNAVLSCLHNHKDLGIHTEMFSDGIIPLIEKGIINGKYKKLHPGAIVSSFALGSRALYDFMDDNLNVRLLDVEYVNFPINILRNPKVTAINSAIEIDLYGQVCADSIGTKQYSGVGGQMDFMRGAALSEDGKPILALPSVTSKGISRITSMLKPGASVVTTRAHVHYVVTEHGIAYLRGKNLKERAKALIKIAHPEHRERLEKEAREVLQIRI